ncbi:hypothetical protein VTH06DRAFT_2646 [Thermothelomyces fergusii]
MAPHGKQ